MAEISAAKRFFLDRPLGFRTINGKRTWALDGFLGFWGMVTASALTAVPITKLTGHTKRLIDSDNKPEAEKLASRLFKSKAAGDVPTVEPTATNLVNAKVKVAGDVPTVEPADTNLVNANVKVTAHTSSVSETQSEVANG